MKLHITNNSNNERTEWLIFGSDKPYGTPLLELPNTFLNVGQVTAPPYFSGEVDILPETAEPFKFYSALQENMYRFIPYIEINGIKFHFTLPAQDRTIADHNRVKINLFRAICGGFGYAELITYVFHDSPAVRFSVHFVAESKAVFIQPIKVKLGLDDTNGIFQFVYYHVGGEVFNSQLGDGTGQIWRGRFIFWNNALLSNPKEINTAVAQMTSLEALGPFETWGAWKKKPITFSDTDLAKVAADFKHDFSDPFAHFGLINNKRPPDTGGQAGFGVWGVPWLPGNKASILITPFLNAVSQEAVRPIYFKEPNGEIVKSSDHPNLVTWGERPHWHPSVSPDQLGRTHGGYNFLGWEGHDPQHQGWIQAASMFLITGDFALQRLVKHSIEQMLEYLTLPSTHQGWSTNDPDHGRAISRVNLQQVYTYLATGDKRILDRAWARFTECIRPYWEFIDWGAGQRTKRKWQPTSPVKPYTYVEDIRLPVGGGPAWVVWQDALAVPGIDALACVYESLGETDKVAALREFVWEVGKGVAMYGYYPDGGKSVAAAGLDANNEIIDYNNLIKVHDDANTDYARWNIPCVVIVQREAEKRNDTVVVDRCKFIRGIHEYRCHPQFLGTK